MITLTQEWSGLNPRVPLSHRYADDGVYRTYHYSTVEGIYAAHLVDNHLGDAESVADREYIKNLIDIQPESRLRRSTMEELQKGVVQADLVKAWYSAYWAVIQKYPAVARLLKRTGDEEIVFLDQDTFLGKCYRLDSYRFCFKADAEFYTTEMRQKYGPRFNPKLELKGDNKIGRILMHIRGRI